MMKLLRNNYPKLGLLLIAVAFFAVWFYTRYPLATRVQIGSAVIQVELAVTDAERAKGLGGRATLAENHGMLFVFPEKTQHGFWMKGMQFPLDFIWIADKTVVDITEGVPPEYLAPLKQLSAKEPINLVLEVPAGTIQKHGIKIGDSFTVLKR